jgi:hypothetical protein
MGNEKIRGLDCENPHSGKKRDKTKFFHEHPPQIQCGTGDGSQVLSGKASMSRNVSQGKMGGAISFAPPMLIPPVGKENNNRVNLVVVAYPTPPN